MRRKLSSHFKELCVLICLTCVTGVLHGQSSGSKQAKVQTTCLANVESQANTNDLYQHCPGEPVNLNSTIVNMPPDGCVLRWYTQDFDKSPDKLYATPEDAKPGWYFPIFYDTLNQCFGPEQPYQNVVNVKFIGQVYLERDTLYNLFGVKTGDLRRTVQKPVDPRIRWYTNPNHQGQPVADPTAVDEGEYWAFLEFDNCAIPFNTDNSTSKVVMKYRATGDCRAEKNGMMLDYTQSTFITLVCPSDKADLNIKLGQPLPDGCEMRWYTNTEHLGSPYPFQYDAAPGKYYPFFYDPSNDCYSSDYESDAWGVEVIGPDLTPYNDTLYTEFEETTVDLSQVSGTYYYYYNVQWYDNPIHSGSPVPNVHAVPAGKYYPFVTKNGCFNTDSTGIFVTVLYTPAVPVKLTVKVMLQGAMTDNEPKMRNDLQNSHRLPYYSPYVYEFFDGGGYTWYEQINNPNGSAGEVVDWIRMYIFKVGDFTKPLAIRDALLKPDGTIVDTAGVAPWFYPSADPVYIVLNHRNHMEVVSQPINNFVSGDLTYDFTTSLSEATPNPGTPDQMIQRNNVWCMWAGDLWNGQPEEHSRINSNDYQDVLSTGFFQAGYQEQDVNLDGAFDITDINLAYYSTFIAPISFFTHPKW
ncbi:hypothetical protein ACN9ML_06295 [Dyadobacter endophyticus]|uniref:hypothetical protein n=1 Tax=Dyadobacter endophyticus TaxID=1749036 RepID=UPI003CEF805B